VRLLNRLWILVTMAYCVGVGVVLGDVIASHTSEDVAQVVQCVFVTIPVVGLVVLWCWEVWGRRE
jgi:hypothetical protein